MEKIKYRLKGNSSINLSSSDYIGDYLKSLGVANTKSFIERPRLEDQEVFTNLDNVDEAIKELYKGFKENKKFFLQVDSDVDGITSSAIFYSFFTKLFPDAQIEYRVHKGKEHGIIVNTIPIDTDYVIIPDAGSMQIDEHDEMVEKGYKVIIMDHHHADVYQEKENIIIVNNQLSDRFSNKYLSGAGVVYKVIQGFNITYNEEFDLVYHDYADLAALGIVADMMDTRELDNNYIIYKGLNNIKNPMFKALLERQSYSVSSTENPTKIDIAFYVAPLMNGVIRFGTLFDKEELFKGFIDYNNDEIVETQYAGKTREEGFYDYMARISFNIKGRQNREKMKCMEFLIDRIESNNLHKNQVLIVTVSKDDEVTIPKTLTGLVAMELLKKYNRPTLVLRPRTIDGESYFAGSGRARKHGDFNSFREFLNNSNFCEYAAGHDMAFGTEIKEENIDKLIDYANETLSSIEFEVDEMDVDFIFTEENVNKELMIQFGMVNHIYGMGIPQPKFAFELMLDKMAFSTIGKKGNTVKFRVNGVDFIKFRDKKLAEFIDNSDAPTIKAIVVGRPQINE
jgi:single-stranded-DNA-specific exonuclease